MSTLKERSQAILDEKIAKILPENIKKDVQIFDITGTLETGIDTSDATATAADLPQNKTAYVNGEKITGTILEVPENTTSGGIDMEATWYGQWSEDTSTLECRFEEDRLQRAGSVISIPIMNPYMENNVVDKMGVKAEKIVKGQTIMGVEGTAETGAKIFNSVDEMNNNVNADIDDLAIVYGDAIVNSTGTTHTTSLYFPETVILPNEITIPDDNYYHADFAYQGYVTIGEEFFNINFYLDSRNFQFMMENMTDHNNSINIIYTSTDGINYTRTTMHVGYTTADNPITFSDVFKFETIDINEGTGWHDEFGYFVQTIKSEFNGLYKYSQYEDKDYLDMLSGVSLIENNDTFSVEYTGTACAFIGDLVTYVNSIRKTLGYNAYITSMMTYVDKKFNLYYFTTSGSSYTTELRYLYDNGKLFVGYNTTSSNRLYYKLTVDVINQTYEQTQLNVLGKMFNDTYDYVEEIPSNALISNLCIGSAGVNWSYGTIFCGLLSSGTVATTSIDMIPCTFFGYLPAPTQFTATADYVYDREFFGENGVEVGTMQNSKNLTKEELVRRCEIYSLTSELKPAITDFSYLFRNNLSKKIILPKIDLSGTKSINMLFPALTELEYVDINNLDTAHIENMSCVFYHNEKATTILCNKISTENCTNMTQHFEQCKSVVELDIRNYNTRKVTGMSNMFRSNQSLVHIYFGENFTFESMTSGVSYMFYDVPNLDNDTLNEILRICVTGTNITTKTLKNLGLSSSQCETCTSLSNYQAFLNAGWTTGY